MNLTRAILDITAHSPQHLSQVAQLFQSSQSIFIASWKRFLGPNPGRKNWGIRVNLALMHRDTWYIIKISHMSYHYISHHHSWGFQNLKSPCMNECSWISMKKALKIYEHLSSSAVFKGQRSCRLGSCLGCIRGGKSWSARRVSQFANGNNTWKGDKPWMKFDRFGQFVPPFFFASWE